MDKIPWQLLGAAYNLILPIIIAALLGMWGDSIWGTKPLLTVLGIILGSAAGFYSFFMLVMRKKK